MRHTRFVLLSLFCLILLNFVDTSVFAQQERRRIKTQQIETAQLSLQDGKLIEGKRRIDSKREYNELTLPTEEIRYKPNGEIEERRTTKYAEQKHIAETAHFGSNGKQISRTVTTYLAPGKAKETVSYDADNKISGRSVFIYSDKSKSQPAEVVRYDKDGKLKGRIVYTYDATKPEPTIIDQTSVENYDADGNLVRRNVRMPDDENGNRVWNFYDGSGKLLNMYVHDRRNNQIIDQTAYLPDGTTRRMNNEQGKAVNASAMYYNNVQTSQSQYAVEKDAEGRPIRVVNSYWNSETNTMTPVSVQYYIYTYY